MRARIVSKPLLPLLQSTTTFSRERLRRVLRKKASAELRLIYIFTSSPLHIHILTYISAHLHIYIDNCTSTSLHIFTSSHRHLCSFSPSHIYISAHVHICTSTSLLISTSSHLHLPSAPLALLNTATKRNPLRRSCVSSARNAGESAIGFCLGQPSTEIVRVGCAKCRRECDLVLSGATLCGDRACRVREMQAKVRFVPVAGSPLRGSCVSSA